MERAASSNKEYLWMSNKQSHTADRGLYSSMRLGMPMPNLIHHHNTAHDRMLCRSWNLQQFFGLTIATDNVAIDGTKYHRWCYRNKVQRCGLECCGLEWRTFLVSREHKMYLQPPRKFKNDFSNWVTSSFPVWIFLLHGAHYLVT